jgi:S-DNA-T family DNA segregation ATPase FtsK/SpoIIIE
MAQRIKAEIIGVCSILGSLYLGLSLLSYWKWDPSFFTFTTAPVKNYGGIVGAYISDTLITFLGISSYALPLFLLAYGIKSILLRETHRVHLLGAVLFVFSLTVLSALIASSFQIGFDAGGIIGKAVGKLLVKGLSTVGAYILALALFLSSLILLSPVSLIYFLTKPRRPKAEPSRKETPETVVFEPEVFEPEKDEIALPIGVDDPLAIETEYSSDRDEKTEAAGRYELPGVELLRLYDTATAKQSKEELELNSSLLQRKLADFSVQGRVTNVHAGPVVTMYEFEPAPGVKINRVVSLSDDLALALKALSVRISPVPGKSTIGIEIPNRQRETVSLREIISSEGFMRSASKLTLALGKDIFGNPVVADLTKMPHLLVAGSTGSGKSVSLNSMVVSILYKASPEEVKMLMIDPKLLELSSYDGIPHLISPVITNPKEAAEMLRKMVFEMERRYRLIAERGARNIESFNATVPDEERLPYIVIFIDELADLMFAAASQVEDSIARLAQMARASGIHLVLATQRPSVDVITGVIKANFPARIAFQVTSKIDSRTIIDSQGAEQLIGRGDMLFMLPGMRIIRVHGALVTEEEVRAVADFIKQQGTPDYSIIEKIETEVAAAEEANSTEERDELYQKALEYAESIGEISISSIQRRLKVGYNRAARIMELMEEDGLVGPPKGAGKPRDFLGRKRLP